MTKKFELHLGKSQDVLKDYPENHFDSVVCDPPYHLTSIVKRFGGSDAAPAQFGTDGAYARASRGFMGKEWDGGDIAFQPGFWAEILRVLKPGGHLIAFSGSRTYHRMACGIEDAGFEIRDQIMWLYGSGFPKSHNLDGEWQGWGSALKPAHEPIVLARKPLTGTIAENVLTHGTGALNIDGCRIDAEPRTFTGTPNRHGGQMAGGGVGGDMRPDWCETRGRWPANVIHDGSDEVTAGFPNTTSGSLTGQPRVENKIYGSAGSTIGTPRFHDGDSGSATRFFYCAKASKEDRDEGLGGFEEKPSYMVENGSKTASSSNGVRYERHTVNRNTHPTVKPTDLMRYLCRLVTPPGGVVLDPFMGSGSTGKAAMLEGFQFVGIDMTPEYLEIASARIQHAHDQKHDVVSLIKRESAHDNQRSLFDDL